MNFGTICPNLSIYGKLENGRATVEEYKEAEEWMDSTISQIPPDWTNLQKLAYIDYCICQRVSYAPTFDTEMENTDDTRSIWRIVNSGYGVCNGISELEVYMLKKAGIDAERVSGVNHAFVKVKDLEMPEENGKTVKGDTIVDPTWNLTANRFGFRPDLFCISYETARKKDIGSSGKDFRCHQNEEISGITLELSKENTTKVFQSIGVITREDGKFPAYEIAQKAREIDSKPISSKEKMEKLLSLIPAYREEFATCQNSTISFLQNVVLPQPNLVFDACVLGKVYQREDQEKKPIVYAYSRFPDGSEAIFYADAEKKSFVPLSIEEFDKRFSLYETELEERKGKKPWEQKNYQKEENLALSSDSRKVALEGQQKKGEER